jgi:hypothetical protein
LPSDPQRVHARAEAGQHGQLYVCISKDDLFNWQHDSAER